METGPRSGSDTLSLGILLGRRVARERERHGLSRSAFARRVDSRAGDVRGTSRTALRNLEEGRVDAPRKEVVQAIAAVLGVREEWLWTGRAPRVARSYGPESARAERRRADSNTAARARRADVPGDLPDIEVGVPDVPDGHPVWGPGVARTIASRSTLAQGPRTVRVRFWSVLRDAADRPGSGVSGPDDALRLARELDELVLRPLDLLRPDRTREGSWFERYAVSVLDSVESVLREDPAGPVARAPHPSDTFPERRSLGPRALRSTERIERDGLTWRLM